MSRRRDCATQPAECGYLAGSYLDVVKVTEGRADAHSLYWATRAYNALATEAFATLETLPASAEVHVVLASIHRDQGRPTEAVAELKAALTLRPGIVRLRRNWPRRSMNPETSRKRCRCWLV